MAQKKKTAKKTTTAQKQPAVKAIKEPMNKTETMNAISDKTGLTKKQVNAVFDALGDLIQGHIKKGAAGTFTVPGLMKVKTVRKPAQKARKNVPNPFRPGEVMDVAAKPARTVVKVLPLKRMKEMAN